MKKFFALNTAITINGLLVIGLFLFAPLLIPLVEPNLFIPWIPFLASSVLFYIFLLIVRNKAEKAGSSTINKSTKIIIITHLLALVVVSFAPFVAFLTNVRYISGESGESAWILERLLLPILLSILTFKFFTFLLSRKKSQ